MSNLPIHFFKNASGSAAEEHSLILAIVIVGTAIALSGLHGILFAAFEYAAALLGGDGSQAVSDMAGY